jgi:hypothetical protein
MTLAYVYLTTSVLSEAGNSFNNSLDSYIEIVLVLLFSKNLLIFETILSGSPVRLAKPVNVVSLVYSS